MSGRKKLKNNIFSKCCLGGDCNGKRFRYFPCDRTVENPGGKYDKQDCDPKASVRIADNSDSVAYSGELWDMY